MFGNSRRLKLGSRCWYTVLSHLTNRKIQALIYSLFWEVASPGGWGKQVRTMYCERLFSFFKKGWVQLLYGPFESKKRLNVMGGAGCTAGSECITTTTLVYSRNKATNQVWANQEIKSRPSNGLEVARGKQYRSNHLLLLSSYTE